MAKNDDDKNDYCYSNHSSIYSGKNNIKCLQKNKKAKTNKQTNKNKQKNRVEGGGGDEVNREQNN